MVTAGNTRKGGLSWLLGGIVLGILGTVFIPRLAAPYLPDALRGEQREVAGVVEAKSTEVDRLLLTVGGTEGAMLVTYSEDVAEIDLLVDVGDSVVLAVDDYAPFVEDARIRRVTKRPAVPDSAPEAASADSAEVSRDTAEDSGDTVEVR